MAIAIELSTLSNPQLVADLVAVAVAIASEMSATAAAGAVANAAADNHPRDGHNDVIIDNGPPSTLCSTNGDEVNAFPQRLLAGEGAVAMPTIITSSKKTSLRAYFEEVNWLLNKALSRRAEFMSGPLGNIVRQCCLRKMQVERQLLIYKKGNFVNKKVTRTKVAHAVVYTNKVELDDKTFVSDDTPECQALWEMSTDNVFE